MILLRLIINLNKNVIRCDPHVHVHSCIRKSLAHEPMSDPMRPSSVRVEQQMRSIHAQSAIPATKKRNQNTQTNTTQPMHMFLYIDCISLQDLTCRNKTSEDLFLCIEDNTKHVVSLHVQHLKLLYIEDIYAILKCIDLVCNATKLTVSHVLSAQVNKLMYAMPWNSSYQMLCCVALDKYLI